MHGRRSWGSIGGFSLVLAVAGLASACGHANPRTAEMGSLRGPLVGANADPTLRPSRLLPENVDESLSYGSEIGGGTRLITAGLRVVASPKGGIVAADDRLPQAPQITLALPERLGGGFLFVIAGTIYRADRWLGPALPVFTSPSVVQTLLVGLDRVYVRLPNAVLAIDGRTGQALDLGPWPASPYVASYAAVDGWRAAAVTDLRGVVATFDAGASWRPVELPIDGKQVVVTGDSLAIGGYENGKVEVWYELRSDGSVARLSAAPPNAKGRLLGGASKSPTGTGFPSGVMVPPKPSPPKAAKAGPSEAEAEALSPLHRRDGIGQEDFATKTFGKRPLAAAIEDGWPLTDGSAVVARDGTLARIRLADGALTELVRNAFPLPLARCHPVSLTRATAVGAFGFVCGEPRGTTVLYAYEPLRGRMSEIKRFDKPRVVTSSGNGALVVRGSCAEDADPPVPPRPEPYLLQDPDLPKGPKAKAEPSAESRKQAPEKEKKTAPVEIHPYCVLGHDNTWREVHVRGELGGERVIVLTDGRIVVVSPPQSLGGPARITVLDKGRASTAAVVFPRVTTDVARVLRLGMWLDGFEERRTNVVGGWIEAGGVMLGLEIALDGNATPGQFLRDAGMPFVSGKYGLGWTASRRGYETTDGGMTWTSLDLPDPLVPIAKIDRRACGPIGCLANGWLRVGWGDTPRSNTAAAPAVHRSTSALSVPQVQLACEPLAPAPPPVATKAKAAPATVEPSARVRLGGFGGPPVLGSFNGLSELRPFLHHTPPTLRDSERGIDLDVRELAERYPNVGSLARVYGWGPKSGDWDTLGRWQVKWLSPFAGWPELRSSLPSLPPPIVVDFTRATSGYGSYYGGYGSASNWQLASADDPAHALLLGKRIVRSEGVVFELEADRAPIEVHRADGEPFGEIEGIVRVAGRWFLTTPPIPTSAAPVTIVWQVEGGVARELARIPRVAPEGTIASSTSSSRTKLARRSDGRAIGLVVEGQPTAERSTNVRWVVPINLDHGTLGEPESLGYVDLAGKTLEICTDDMTGWTFDGSMPSTVRVRLPAGSGAINSLHARLRLTGSRGCIERLAGTYDGQTPERAAQLTRSGPANRSVLLRPGEMQVTALSSQTRYPLRCSIAK